MQLIPLLSTIVTFIFTVSVFNRYRLRKGTHLLFWGIGLLFYGLGVLSEVILGFTYSTVALKLWYLMGAMLTAAWLGQGTVFLLVRRRGVARAMAGALIVVSLVALILVMVAPVNTEVAAAYDVSQPASSQYGDILVRNGAIVALTILLNIYGTLTLVGGAIYSAYLFWRKKILFNRILGNILIAAGALLPATGGTLVKAGLVDLLYLSELLGAVLMYVGFLQATVTKPAAASAEANPTPGPAAQGSDKSPGA